MSFLFGFFDKGYSRIDAEVDIFQNPYTKQPSSNAQCWKRNGSRRNGDENTPEPESQNPRRSGRRLLLQNSRDFFLYLCRLTALRVSVWLFLAIASISRQIPASLPSRNRATLFSAFTFILHLPLSTMSDFEGDFDDELLELAGATEKKRKRGQDSASKSSGSKRRKPESVSFLLIAFSVTSLLWPFKLRKELLMPSLTGMSPRVRRIKETRIHTH